MPEQMVIPAELFVYVTNRGWGKFGMFGMWAAAITNDSPTAAEAVFRKIGFVDEETWKDIVTGSSMVGNDSQGNESVYLYTTTQDSVGNLRLEQTTVPANWDGAPLTPQTVVDSAGKPLTDVGGEIHAKKMNTGQVGIVGYKSDKGLVLATVDPATGQAGKVESVAGPEDWAWAQFGVGANDEQFISVYSGLNGGLATFRRASDQMDWTRQDITATAGDTVGMYNSMVVNPNTSTAHMSYVHSVWGPKIAWIDISGQYGWHWVPNDMGVPIGAGVAIDNNGQVNNWWLAGTDPAPTQVWGLPCP